MLNWHFLGHLTDSPAHSHFAWHQWASEPFECCYLPLPAAYVKGPAGFIGSYVAGRREVPEASFVKVARASVA